MLFSSQLLMRHMASTKSRMRMAIPKFLAYLNSLRLNIHHGTEHHQHK